MYIPNREQTVAKSSSSSDTSVQTDSIEYPLDFLQTAFERFKIRVFSENIFPDKFHPRRACFEPNLEESKISIKEIAIKEQEAHHTQVSEEAYAIDVSLDDATMTIRIVGPKGALLAFDSLA